MEIKAILEYPFTENDRLIFIEKYNYNLHYDIIEKDNLIEAWGYTKEEEEEQERKRIQSLTCTKRVLILMLEELGLDYFNQIQPLIEANRQAKLEWELASELLRSNPLIDDIGKQLGVSHEQLDLLFRYANGEISKDEFMPTVKEIK